MAIRKFLNSRVFTVGVWVFLILGITLALVRAWNNHATTAGTEKFDWSSRGLSDFQSMYFYSKSFRLGLSPYGPHERTDLMPPRASAPFSPAIFYGFWPLTYLSLHAAEVVACAINVAMLGLIGVMFFRYSNQPIQSSWWMAVVGFLVWSRPGHITLYTGYFTALLVLGTMLAFHNAKNRPWLAALGVLMASAKPTYIIPLLVLLVFRRNYKAAFYGTALSALVACAGITWLAFGHPDASYSSVIDTVLNGQEAFHDDPTEEPINTWTRIDVLGMVAKIIDWKPGNKVYLLAMLALIIPPGLAIRKMAHQESNSAATGLSAFIGSLALLVTLYHHSYDCLLFAVPWLAMIFFGKQTLPTLSAFQRWTVSLLLLVPMINYAATLSFREFFQLAPYGFTWQAITQINGLCITAALITLMWNAWQQPSPLCTPEHK